MRKQITAAAAAAALLTGVAVDAQSATAAPLGAGLVFGADRPGDASLERTQYLWGGRNYCFYFDGWRGPGWYWCGYRLRRGYGWGGPRGWHGWRYDRGGHWHDGGWHGHGDWHGRGGWHDGRGGWHGGHYGGHHYHHG
jgi:hypothetical protein